MLFQLVFPVVNIITHFTLKCYVLVCLYVLTQPFFGHSFITNVTLHVCMRLCNVVLKHKLSEEFSSTCKTVSLVFLVVWSEVFVENTSFTKTFATLLACDILSGDVHSAVSMT